MKHYIVTSKQVSWAEALLTVQNDNIIFVKNLSEDVPTLDFSFLKGTHFFHLQQNIDAMQLQIKETPVVWDDTLSNTHCLPELQSKSSSIANFVMNLDFTNWQQANFYDRNDEQICPATIDDNEVIIYLKFKTYMETNITLLVKPLSDHLLVQWSEKGSWTEEFDIIEFADWCNDIDV